MGILLEIIAYSAEALEIAESNGADRIELCDNPHDGGTTPSHGRIRQARRFLDIPLFPIIRPRGGDFLYSNEEFRIMEHDILQCKDLGCDGVVLGLLRADGTIDRERTSALVEAAYPMDVTFHRAFDRVNDPMQALQDVISTGCSRILTSGLRPTVSEGLETITRLQSAADGRIVIMPGSGVRPDNILEIVRATGVTEIHSSASVLRPSAMEYLNPLMKESMHRVLPDADSVRRMTEILRQAGEAETE
jgi:copper homeostasis protein